MPGIGIGPAAAGWVCGIGLSGRRPGPGSAHVALSGLRDDGGRSLLTGTAGEGARFVLLGRRG